MLKNLLITALVPFSAAARQAPACLSAQGTPVDWWLALKHPLGDTFSYTDASSAGEWAPPRPGLASPSPSLSPLAATLGPLYSPSPSPAAYALWNDEPPPPPRDNGTAAVAPAPPPWFAHSKGAVALTEHGGWLLVHSAPRWPPAPSGGSYTGLAPPQQVYGQAFLCLSLDAAGAGAAVAGLARGLRPRTFAASDPGGQALKNFPGFPALARPRSGRRPPPSGLHITYLTTAGGAPLALFTSAGSGGREGFLWDHVARNLPAPLLAVASWRRGPGRALPPACGGSGSPAVLNVLSIRPPGAAAAWSGEDDHGKWGVAFGAGVGGGTVPSSSCVGDANREESQLRRGGAVVCLVGSGVLRAAVAAVDECKLLLTDA
jgi:deoxyribonuclease-2